MGQLLGCGAHLESLRRTAVAEFEIAQAFTLEDIENKLSTSKSGQTSQTQNALQEIQEQSSPRLEKNCHSEPSRRRGEEPAFPRPEVLESLFVHPRQLLPQFPSVTADEPTVARILTGRPINLPEHSRARQVKVFQGQRDLIAIATRVAGTLFHPKIVFPLA
jgi:tRNA pseudouridine55 synthase